VLLTPSPASGARADAWRTFAKDDPAFFEVVWSHLDVDAIADNGADAEFPHLAGRVGDDPVLVLKNNAEAAIGKDFIDLALKGHKIFFGHVCEILAREVSGREPRRS
jgi:hypothetical protein